VSGAPVLDAAVLDELTAAVGTDAVRGIIEMFLGECSELVETIAAAATPRDALRAAHSLKSSAGQLGAAALAEAALAVEIAAESNAAELPRRVAVLVDCAGRSQAALAARLAASG
jgi:HPt (histidine-containing phosphotransfer) domain-containing protein